MEKLILLDELNETSVSVVTKKYIVDDGVRYFVGEPHRRGYVNSNSGRAEIQEELEEPYLTSVMTIWGDVALVDEPDEDNKE